ncbi:unnamed protein product [Vicia faba]|uniref:Uncharacterized protein n=1 Tax=Vicia faba TaxID=3906 RepID=A0AAV1B5J6_VICFA|nr:unnamed protein product [Vicia faba]
MATFKVVFYTNGCFVKDPDDSEEERMNEFDERVGAGVDGEPIIETVANSDVPSEPVKTMFIIEEMGKTHVIEDVYMTDELDSDDDDDNCDERSRVIRFKAKYALSKDFVFKVGMKFCSLRQFKDAILEHNVLNGRDDDDVLDVQPLSIDKSPLKPSVKTFFGKTPKVCKNKPFKVP